MEKILEERKERPGTSLRKHALLEQIAAYVDANLTEKLTLKVISAQCGVSVSTVERFAPVPAAYSTISASCCICVSFT